MQLVLFIITIFFIIGVIKFLRTPQTKKFLVKLEHPDLRKIENPEIDFPYVKRDHLMSHAEFNFYQVLQAVVQDRYYIIPQVVLAKLVDVDRNEYRDWGYRSKIDKKTVDFVLFNKPYFTPEMIIELDDTSHQIFDSRKNRDDFLNKLANHVGIKIAHVPNSYHYDPKEIAKILS